MAPHPDPLGPGPRPAARLWLGAAGRPRPTLHRHAPCVWDTARRARPGAVPVRRFFRQQQLCRRVWARAGLAGCSHLEGHRGSLPAQRSHPTSGPRPAARPSCNDRLCMALCALLVGAGAPIWGRGRLCTLLFTPICQVTIAPDFLRGTPRATPTRPLRPRRRWNGPWAQVLTPAGAAFPLNPCTARPAGPRLVLLRPAPGPVAQAAPRSQAG